MGQPASLSRQKGIVMTRYRDLAGWLHRRAENILALMVAVMFGAFIMQVAFRYLLGLPSGGFSELTVVMWLWLVLWGAAFVLREDEEVRFDVVWGIASPRVRRVMSGLAAAVLLALYGWSLPAMWDYVTFMKVQKTSYLDIRFDWLFSIYILFAVAVLARYVWILVTVLRGRDSRGAPSGVRDAG